MKEVTIIQKFLPHYRVEFFEGLQKELKKENIKLNLIYGSPTQKEALKKDKAEISWAIKIQNKTINIGPIDLYWQPCLAYIKHSDLIIVEQANKNIINYLLLLKRFFHKRKIAYWGHGLNLQSHKYSFRNKFKRRLVSYCDWWFAYTSSVKNFLVENGFPEQRITIVQNSIDTKKIRENILETPEYEINELKTRLGIKSSNIGIYCGGIYNEKRIPFLIEAAKLIKKSVADFHLLIIGSGPDVPLLQNLIAECEWINYLGPKFGKDKSKLLKLAKVFLMPGLVGLAILDAFASGTPLITSNYPFHSPEIEYLQSGKNGIISQDNVESYAFEVIKVFKEDSLYQTLVEGCKKANTKYTLEAMIKNYKEGIIKCLNT